jgi:hypothetical protein
MADTSSIRTRQQMIDTQKQMQAAYPQVLQTLLRIPGVVKVGIGIKETNGQLTGEPVFRVYVEEKKPAAAVPPGELIPAEIGGFKTDVVIVRPEQLEDDDSKYRPLKPGCQVEPAGYDGVGTLGCLATLVSDNSVVLLSNHHVLYQGTVTDGVEVGQPTYGSSCCCTCGDVAVNVHGIDRAFAGAPANTGHLDCAIARVKPGVKADPEILEVGPITGTNNAVLLEAVKKRGRTTGFTQGTVTNLTMDTGGTRILEIEVKTNNGQVRFSAPGDSGSAYLNAADEMIGLHRSGNNGDKVTAGNFSSTGIGIQEVLNGLQADGFQINIMTGMGGGEAAVRSQAEPVGLTDALWVFEQRLKRTQSGTRFWQALHRHHKELARLVNEVRPVMVAWQRKKGPAYLAALVRSLKEPRYEIPTEIESITREDAISTLTQVVLRHGSAALRADLEIYRSSVAEAMLHATSTEEMIHAWEQMATDEQELSTADS